MTKRLLALIFAIVMVLSSVALVACDDADTDANVDTKTTTTTASATKSKYTVTLVDSLTGYTIETVNVSAGGKPSFFSNVKSLYYGYQLDEEDYKGQLVAATSDYTVTLHYKEADLVYIQVLDRYGNKITPTEGKTFTFHKALTAEEIKATYTPQEIKGGAAEEAYNDVETLPDADGRVWQYKGASFDASADIVNVLPSFLGATFDCFYIVKSATDNAYTNNEFTGAVLEKNVVIRPSYTVNAAVLYAQDFAGKTIAQLCNEIVVMPKDPLTAAAETKLNNETGKLEYVNYNSIDNENVYDPSGMFVYAGGMGEGFSYTSVVATMKKQWGPFWYDESDPAQAFNHYTGKLAGTYGQGYNIQIDNNYYMTYDGEKVYVFILVRDDTVVLDKGTVTTDYYTGELLSSPVSYDYTSLLSESIPWTSVDNVEFRYYFGSAPYVYQYKGIDSYDYQGKDMNSMRAISITASGQYSYGAALNDAIPFLAKDGKTTVKMGEYAEVVDLNPTDTTRKSLDLYDKSGNVNGYELCVALRVKDFYEALGYNWDEVETFDIIVGSQINDCVYPLRKRTVDNAWVTLDSDYWQNKRSDALKKGYENNDQMTVGTGTQTIVKYFSRVTLVNTK